MPLYEYISEQPGVEGKSCRMCSKGFELRRPVDRAPLENCPLCRKPVKKVISRINTPSITKPMSKIDAKKAGFTVLEKRIDGNYEKL
ncbi:zinc ribbon domain-containing protein [Rubritalea spongiae]|uniref:Zinc ribbon domain-containing protein n=1 Tax=Rubritalea spongiae TaxID=430797 RepID=A0ABW5E0L6_9BACT